jgi:hypothetical protein
MRGTRVGFLLFFFAQIGTIDWLASDGGIRLIAGDQVRLCGPFHRRVGWEHQFIVNNGDGVEPGLACCAGLRNKASTCADK